MASVSPAAARAAHSAAGPSPCSANSSTSSRAAKSDAEDRRSVRLTLSAAGLAAQQAMRAEVRALNEQALAGLSAKEQAQLAELLGRVKANLDAQE